MNWQLLDLTIQKWRLNNDVYNRNFATGGNIPSDRHRVCVLNCQLAQLIETHRTVE